VHQTGNHPATAPGVTARGHGHRSSDELCVVEDADTERAGARKCGGGLLERLDQLEPGLRPAGVGRGSPQQRKDGLVTRGQLVHSCRHGATSPQAWSAARLGFSQNGPVTTATRVPVTVDYDGAELDAEDAWHTVRRHGAARLVAQSFLRFRYGDGFTNSRALALQIALSVVPFLLALTGLAADLDEGRAADVVAATVEALTPGGGDTEAVGNALRGGDDESENAGELALGFGLAFSLVSMATAMAQVERGSNRIYGIPRDRPALHKYGRAAVMMTILALPTGVGFMLLVAGSPLGQAMAHTYAWSDSQLVWWQVLRWPIGLALTTFAIAVLLNHSPRRRQPGLSWLALGAGVGVLITMLASATLAAYVHFSGSFGSVYGPLAGVMALLLWCYLSSIALFFGTALAAQLEAVRAGLVEPIEPDPGATEAAERSSDAS